MKKVFFVLGVLLSFGLFCACSSDEEVSPVSSSPENGEERDSVELKSCISGTICLTDEGDGKDLVFINELQLPKGDDTYSNIKTVVVLKDEFPLIQYQAGDIISFKIIKIWSSYPRDDQGLDTPTKYLCSIELCE